jgi:hypothetical protein
MSSKGPSSLCEWLNRRDGVFLLSPADAAIIPANQPTNQATNQLSQVIHWPLGQSVSVGPNRSPDNKKTERRTQETPGFHDYKSGTFVSKLFLLLRHREGETIDGGQSSCV